MRLKIFREADKNEMAIISLSKKHGVSRKWFYKWKKRRDGLGDEGLKLKIGAAPKMPNGVSKEVEQQILNFIKEYPTYGPERIEAELRSAGISVGHTGIYNVFKKRGLNTAKSRLEWLRRLSGEVVTQDEISRDKEKSKTNYVEANYPGQLVVEDSFYIGCLKGIGRIYHQVACDCFSFFGAAKVYNNKTTDASTDFVGNYLSKKFATGKDRKNPYLLWARIYHLAWRSDMRA
jgi:transposase